MNMWCHVGKGKGKGKKKAKSNFSKINHQPPRMVKVVILSHAIVSLSATTMP